MLTKGLYYDQSVILKALADDNRLKVMHELMGHEMTVTQLARTLGLKVPNISKHLRVLELCGMVSQRKKGNQRLYRISSNNTLYMSGNERILDLGFCELRLSRMQTPH